MLHQSYGNLLQEGAHHALVEEALAETARHQHIANLRKNAAGQKHAAPRAVEQAQVAHEAAQQATEHLQRFHGSFVAAFQRRLRHLARLRQHGRLVAQRTDRAIEVEQAGARQRVLERHVGAVAGQVTKNLDLAFVARRQRDLARFGGQHRGVRMTRQQHRRTQARARTHHQHRTGRWRRFALDHRGGVGLAQELGGVGHRFEIVDDGELFDAQAVADVADGDRPRQVVVDDGIAQHVAGTGHRTAVHMHGVIKLAHEVLQHGGQARPVGAGVAVVLQHRHRTRTVRLPAYQPDACVRSSDVRGEEHGFLRHELMRVVADPFAHCDPLVMLVSRSCERDRIWPESG